jgi:hypothetical protein
LTPNFILDKIRAFEKWTSQRCHMKRMWHPKIPSLKSLSNLN